MDPDRVDFAGDESDDWASRIFTLHFRRSKRGVSVWDKDCKTHQFTQVIGDVQTPGKSMTGQRADDLSKS